MDINYKIQDTFIVRLQNVLEEETARLVIRDLTNYFKDIEEIVNRANEIYNKDIEKATIVDKFALLLYGDDIDRLENDEDNTDN
jgi:hypothetical protein